MPDPKTLKVGDRVHFIALPDSWSRKDIVLPKDSIAFMKIMLKRKHPSEIEWIDEYGVPWISARIHRRGKYEEHTWGILESSGWRLVKRRTAKTRRGRRG